MRSALRAAACVLERCVCVLRAEGSKTGTFCCTNCAKRAGGGFLPVGLCTRPFAHARAHARISPPYGWL
eukprot:CAMPEP_0171161108 /NCGR_PEP_ID=MMETSP0790-20130122/3902_1 /TAXON_ID=2925 /ORGANISM="Alexandrium catenella, Strain OF101" /LENGTH=68 /DNA_ID=CAMNT_0011625661 /DNA_START=129 /DNA_END=332 /DNA_ORIENTATION=-